jgi:hypothetical protein
LLDGNFIAFVPPATLLVLESVESVQRLAEYIIFALKSAARHLGFNTLVQVWRKLIRHVQILSITERAAKLDSEHGL